MDDLPMPPWSAAADEVAGVDRAKFAACDAAIDAYLEKSGNSLVEKKYTLSPQWGAVLRASAQFGHADKSRVLLLNFWSVNGSTVEMAMKIQDPRAKLD